MYWHINATVVSIDGERVTFFKVGDTPLLPIFGGNILLPCAVETFITYRAWWHCDNRTWVLNCWCALVENVERQMLLDMVFTGVLTQNWSAYDLTPGIGKDSKNDPRARRGLAANWIDAPAGIYAT